MFRSRFVHAATVVAVLITGWFVLDDRALAIQDSEDKVWFGPVGFGIGQGVRINVYTTGTPATGGIAVPDTRWEFDVKDIQCAGCRGSGTSVSNHARGDRLVRSQHRQSQ